MNKSYRLIWSARHGGLVAVAENSRGRAKGGRSASVLVTAIAGAIAVLAGGQASAANLCTSASTAVSTAQGAGDNCTLANGAALVVTSGGVISAGLNTNAVIVNGTPAGSLTNSGTLTGAHSNANAIGAVVVNGTLSGDFVNQAGGLIQRTGDGSGGGAVIEFKTNSALTGSLINQAGGHIESDQYGVLVRGNSVIGGGLTNAGTITSGDAFNVIYQGTSIGGSVVNTSTGVMDVQWGGISLSSASVAGSVRNDGTISVAGGSGGMGVGVSGSVGGDVINTGHISVGGTSSGVGLDATYAEVQGAVSNSGTISVSGNYGGTGGEIRAGIHASNSSIVGGIVNSGTVFGGDAGVNLGENLEANFVNQASGSINGGIGVRLGIDTYLTYYTSEGFTPPTAATMTGSITNHGNIQGASGAGLSLQGAALEGSITNAAGSTISGATSGIEVGPGHWTALGYGGSSSSSMTSTGSVNSSVTGGITNSGLIQGTTEAGVHVNQSSVGGSIMNLLGGTITGDTGILVDGEIESLVVGSITNAGTITGTGRDAIRVDHSTVSGGIANSGRLEGQNGIGLQDAQVSGGVQNSGTIAGSYNGIYIDSSTVSGGVSNSGTVSVNTTSGAQAPIYIESSTISGDVLNTGFLSISADSDSAYGVALGGSTLSGSIVNSGTIVAQAPGWSSGIGLNLTSSSISGGITNSGLIQGGGTDTETGYGVYLDNTAVSGSIVNSGTILGTGSSAGYGVELGSATVGGISNTGVIHGRSTGLALNGSTINGAILNSAGGTISGGETGLYIDPNSAVAEGISNAGLISGEGNSVMLRNGASQIIFDNSGTLQGDVDLGSMGNTLNLNGNQARVIGDVSSYSLSGTVNVNGDFTSEGTFLLRYLNVNNGALFTLNHDVTVLTTTVAAGATVDVGAGNRTIGYGNYVQNGTLRLTLNDASTYGNLTVGGNATLGNASVIDVRLSGTPGQRINGVIVAGGTLTDNGVTVTDNSLLYNFTADTTRNAQELDLVSTADTQGLTNAAATTGNPGTTGVAASLQTMFNTGIPTGMQPVFNALNNLSSEEIDGALAQMLPSVQGAGSQAGVSALRSMNKIIQARVESNQGLSSGNSAAERYMWVRGFGSWAEQDNHRGVAGFDSNTSGMVIGGDAAVNDKVRAGAAFTYAKSDIDSKSTGAPSSVDVNTYELVGYGSYNIDPRTDVNVQVDVGKNKAKSSRQVFGGGIASAAFDSLAFHASAGIGHLIPVSVVTNFTPSVRVDYTHMETNGYTETGANLGGANLTVGDSTFKELLLTADVKFSHQLNDTIKLVGNVTAGYDFLNKQLVTTSAFVGGGPTFTTQGLDVSPWLYRTGLGLIHDAKKGMEYSVRYDMEGRTSGYINQTVSARVRWQF